jgi:hypothetical protein
MVALGENRNGIDRRVFECLGKTVRGEIFPNPSDGGGGMKVQMDVPER